MYVWVCLYVPCKRKPYMTQLSEPKRLCNYESCVCVFVLAYMYVRLYVCVFVCIGAGICNQAKRLPLLPKLLLLSAIATVVVSAGHADCRLWGERHSQRPIWSFGSCARRSHSCTDTLIQEMHKSESLTASCSALAAKYIQLERKSNTNNMQQE